MKKNERISANCLRNQCPNIKRKIFQRLKAFILNPHKI